MGGPARTLKKTIVEKFAEQPKVASQMDNTDVKSKLIVADKIAPTNVEMDLTSDERIMKAKRRGRKGTVLTSVTGTGEKPTLSKKALLS